ncbi:tetratricopeptide repeat protein [Winogradskyella sp. A3E31]|uniref:tetratricopeptide repeat protein n=1 Tax=Winogradskyella sp. A3E31 TaxID=3349637 RepID=UPI00398A79AD
MKNKLLASFLLLLFFCPLHAQKDVDSLKKIISNTKQDTVKVNAYIHFFFTDLFYDNPQSVIDYSHKARVLSKKIDFTKGLVLSHNNLGYTYRTRSESDSAFYHYNRAIQYAEPISFYKGITDAYIGLGNTYNQLGEWDDAVKQFETVIELAQQEGDSIQIGSAHNNIGNTFLSQSKFENALLNYQKAAELGNASIKGVALINIAVVHNQMGNIDQARDYFQKSIIEAEKLGKKGHLAFINRNLGILEKKTGNFDEALKYYNQALEHYKSLSDDFSSSEIIQNMGNVYFEMNDFDKALMYYNQSLQIQQSINYPTGACYNQLYKANAYHGSRKISEALTQLKLAELCAKELKMIDVQSDVANLMSIIKEEQGDYKAAFDYQKQFKILSDSITTISSKEKIAEIETKYQTTQKEQEIELLSADNEISKLKIQKQQNLRNFLIIAAVILVLLLLAVYSRYNLKIKANKKLRELDELKTKFYTNISHEFRTPLTLILNPLNNILATDSDDDIQSNAKLAHRNADRLLQLTNQMLDLSKIEAGKMTLNVGQQNLKSFLEVIYASFESLAQSKNIAFTKSFNITEEEVYFDTDKLQKVLYNLLSNAFKFTPEKGKVDFICNEKGKILNIEIKDTGHGFDSDEHEQLFKRFQQGDTSNSEPGTGIGLTLSRELVLLHQGTLTLDSTQGEGSSFKISIPITKQAYNKSELVGSSALSHHNNHQSSQAINDDIIVGHDDLPIVLIVEDNDELRQYLGRLFKEGYNVHYAVDGKNGVEEALKLVPDIIISDWMMPNITGDELCKTLKQDQNTSHIPIILLTAKADQSSKLDGLKIGADDYISKPFDNTELLIRAKNLIDQRASLREKYGEKLLIAPSKVNMPDPDKAFIKRAISIVETHISDDTFSSEDFQKALGMSRMQLYRKLKALTDSSASEFIRNLRLQRASDLLSSGHLQVSEVAYQCGFSNLSYFGQCFKDKFGVPPSQFNSNPIT